MFGCGGSAARESQHQVRQGYILCPQCRGEGWKHFYKPVEWYSGPAPKPEISYERCNKCDGYGDIKGQSGLFK